MGQSVRTSKNLGYCYQYKHCPWQPGYELGTFFKSEGQPQLANGLWSNGFMVQAALDGADMNVRLNGDQLSAFTRIYSCGDDRWFMLTILPQLHNLELADLLQAAFMARHWNGWQQRAGVVGT